MKITKKINFRLFFFLLIVLIATASFYYTNNLVKKLKEEEQSHISLWADAYKDIVNTSIDKEVNPLSFRIINNNHTIPVIMTDDKNNIISYANLDSTKVNNPNYLKEQLETMKKQHSPIEIRFSENHCNYLYYRDSRLLDALRQYPYMQAILGALFILIGYFVLFYSQRAEESRILAGMAKETAHQLGTPISSLMAWIEMLKIKSPDDPMVVEVEKDIKRLELITERFARMGSIPKLQVHNIVNSVKEAIDYLKRRTSSNIDIELNAEEQILTLINNSLFQWVIENIGKNAIDAMSGKGKLQIIIQTTSTKILIDIKDQGKGMTKREFKKIFQAGYTTKKYGWGMGLALAQRIIEEYHNGKIFVLKSAPDKGTTFRIELPLLS